MSSHFLNSKRRGDTATRRRGERTTRRHGDAATRPALAVVLCALLLVVPSQLSCSKKGEAKSETKSEVKAGRVLKVCADPNNLPFSNDRGEGFENKIAELIANEMHATVEYTWWAQRRGFIRNTLKAGSCDCVIGVPLGFEMAATTGPYYRSTYVFVYRKDAGFTIHSFDDPILKRLRIGVQMIGDDYANTPPAHALANRHIITNVRGYTLYGDYRQPNPPARIIDAVANGEIDAAIVWGPLAGYFAGQQPTPLELVPVEPQIDQPFLPFVYDISMGVRRGDDALKQELEAIIERKHADIEHILDEYHVPKL
ncbi:MAG: substrate-binding domain-containing protein [Blastocatellia bacterium]